MDIGLNRFNPADGPRAGDDPPFITPGKQFVGSACEATGETKRNAIDPEVVSQVWMAVGKKCWYRGSTKDGLPHGKGQYVAKSYVFDGNFKEGKRHGTGEYITRTGAKLRAAFNNNQVEGVGTYHDKGIDLSCMSPKEFNERSILFISNRQQGWLAQWDENFKLQMFDNDNQKIRFLKPDDFIAAEPYRFRPNTDIVELSNEPDNLTSDLLNRIGFVYHKLDLSRLAASSHEVQQKLFLGLMARHWQTQEESEYELGDIAEDMPSRTGSSGRYFLLIDQNIGNVAAALFANVTSSMARIRSLTVDPKLRRSRLGSLLLCLSVRQLVSADHVDKISLNSSHEAFNWYQQFGFRPIPNAFSTLALDLNDAQVQKAFSLAEAQLAPRILAKALCTSHLSKAIELLPFLAIQTIHVPPEFGDAICTGDLDRAISLLPLREKAHSDGGISTTRKAIGEALWFKRLTAAIVHEDHLNADSYPSDQEEQHPRIGGEPCDNPSGKRIPDAQLESLRETKLSKKDL